MGKRIASREKLHESHNTAPLPDFRNGVFAHPVETVTSRAGRMLLADRRYLIANS